MASFTPQPDQAPAPLPAHLFQLDSYQRRCHAEITRVFEHDGAPAVTLSQTVFYPTAGGQLHDLGTLMPQTGEHIHVLDVFKQEGEVVHVLEPSAPSLQIGDAVAAHLDWRRRYHHMLRHSGQHLLSQAFIRTSHAYETRSVSLTSAVCTLDLAGEPDEAAALEAETLVNNVARQNLPVHAFEVPEHDLFAYKLRRPPKVSGMIRLVNMGGWELSACGGTHVKSTGEVLPIKVVKLERVKGGLTRVHFVVGQEALDDYRLKHEVASGLALEFSSQVDDVPARVTSLQEDVSNLKRDLHTLQGRYAKLLASEWYAAAEQVNGVHVVKQQLATEDAELLRPLAQALIAKDNTVVLLGVSHADKARLLFARSEGVAQDMNALLQKVLPQVDGRGGGKADMAQGAGTKTEGLEEALEQAALNLAR